MTYARPSSDAPWRKRSNSEMTHDPRFPKLPRDLIALAHWRAIRAAHLTKGQSRQEEERDEGEWPYSYIFKALRFSQSYFMAHEVAQKRVDLKRVAIKDFATVRAVYKDLGPVHGVWFEDWRYKLKPGLFAPTPLSQVRQLCTLQTNEALDEKDVLKKVNQGVKHYSVNRLLDGHPQISLVAIPAVGDKEAIVKQLAELVDKLFESSAKVQDVKYTVDIGDDHKRTIWSKLRFQELKILNPKLSHPDALAQVSAEKFDKGELRDAEDRERKSHNVSKMGIRYRGEARFISENAARGIFFSQKELSGIDYQKFSGVDFADVDKIWPEKNKQRTKDVLRLSDQDKAWIEYLGIL